MQDKKDQMITPSQEIALQRIGSWRKCERTLIALRRECKTNHDDDVIVKCAKAESIERDELNRLRAAADKLLRTSGGEH